jgi:lipoic acid synthetase
MHDPRSAGCDFLTLGQYLRPSPQHHPVIAYVEPGTFEAYTQVARGLGFRGVLSGPSVRSSYCAETLLEKA